MGYLDVIIQQLRAFRATLRDIMIQKRSLLLLRDASRVLIMSAAMLLLFLPWAIAQDTAAILGDEAASAEEAGPRIRPVRTDSPRDTLTTFLRLRDDFEQALIDYRANRSVEGAEQLSLLAAQFRALIDLSEVASTSRSEVGNDTLGYLLDIFGRVEVPNLDNVPDEDVFEDEGLAQYRIPETPIRITRIDEGPREGEFLFNSRTVRVAPRFFLSINDLPLRSDLGIRSWSASLPQITGPFIPAAVVLAMPPSMRTLRLDTPIWKVIAVSVIAAIAALLLAILHRWISRIEPESRIGGFSWRLTRPISIMIVVVLLIPFVDEQINTSGLFSTVVETTTTILIYLTTAWLFWLGSRLFFEWIILSPRIPEESLDANLLRLVAGGLGIVGVTIILAYGGQAMGLPIMSVLAGLGIGGLAVALAIRPTLENLIGGVILYVDKPVRVGDFCSFGDRTGTVESIGIRSTQLRGIDRTLVSIPNAQFADMEIVNWARCDEMLINEVIGLRYETTADQLRYFLAKLREMLHAHPRINSETVRVRFSGFGDSSLNVTIRVYAQTREWNDFHAIREDIFLRVSDLVNEAGTGFAFPSRTIYMGKDEGLDTETAQRAADQVKGWRHSGQLPFPRFSPEALEKIDGTLDYPPKGSPEAGHEDLEAAAGVERLSTEPLPDEEFAEEPSEKE
jgi:MscS family membrane protein